MIRRLFLSAAAIALLFALVYSPRVRFAAKVAVASGVVAVGVGLVARRRAEEKRLTEGERMVRR